MISTDKFVNTFGPVPAGDTEKLINLAVLAVRNDFAIVLDEPGAKKPLCPLTARAAKTADREAQEAAQSSGDERWAMRKHACGIHHAFTDDVAIRAVLKRLTKAGIVPNLGVQPRLSRMVNVDTDTREQNDAFLLWWTEHGDRDRTSMKPTVLTPGAQRDGEWIHKDGGHYWFRVPDDFEFPDNLDKITGPGDWVISWGGQVLVPPSSRPEGSYKLVGQSMQLPFCMREFIATKAKEAGDHESAGEIRGSGSITEWAAKTSWSSLLVPDGWTATGRFDGCGCPTWTAPGEHSDPKSATAHEVGCTQYPDEQVNAPLHLWTDNPPDAVASLGKTFSKLNYAAHSRYGGDMTEAKEALGIMDDDDDERPDDDGGVLPGDDGDGSRTAAVAKTPLFLPDGFWESRPELAQIRQKAWSRYVSPDAVLYAVLARLSSMLPGDLRVETGIRTKASLNFFAAVIGGSGDSKGTSTGVARDLVPVPGYLEPGLSEEILFKDRATLGTGEGLAELFMGVTEKKRRQVRHNAFVYVDEGESLTVQMNRENQTAGQTLRSSWCGEPIGQSNASAERSRHAEDYALGVLIGYQPDTAFPLLDGEVLGTPQRFMWCRASVDENPEEDLPEDPGPLWEPEYLAKTLGLDPGDADSGTLALLGERAVTTVTMPGSLKARSFKEARDTRKRPRIDMHRPLSLIKVSGLLAILAGRTEITEEDWSLAATLWGTSCAVRDDLAAEKAKKIRRSKAASIEYKADQAVAVADAQDQVVRVARVLWNAVNRHPDKPETPAALKKRVAGRDKKFATPALNYAMARGWLIEEDGVVVKGDTQPTSK